MKKTTKKDIREYVRLGLAQDITAYDFDQAERLRKAHTLDVITVSRGVYGMTGRSSRTRTESATQSPPAIVHFSSLFEGVQTMTSLDRLENRLNAAGITTRRNYINTERGHVPVLLAEHDYTGPYPTREALDKLDTVRRICARYNVRRELRGYYQATYIREEVAPLDYPVYSGPSLDDYLGYREKILNTTARPGGHEGRKEH